MPVYLRKFYMQKLLKLRKDEMEEIKKIKQRTKKPNMRSVKVR